MSMLPRRRPGSLEEIFIVTCLPGYAAVLVGVKQELSFQGLRVVKEAHNTRKRRPSGKKL